MIQHICQWTASEDIYFEHSHCIRLPQCRTHQTEECPSMWRLIRAKASGSLLKGFTELMNAKMCEMEIVELLIHCGVCSVIKGAH